MRDEGRMIPTVVVDIGNTRIKWGLCADNWVHRGASLSPDEPAEWATKAAEWQLGKGTSWAIAAVHPERLKRIEDWIRVRGDALRVLRDWRDLGLPMKVDHPERVGMDRLLNAVAARSAGKIPAIIVDAGTAITVDYVDEAGAFCGGAILPGLRMMGEALHKFTAQLPLIEPPTAVPAVPGKSTQEAIEAGMYWAAVGGVRAVVTKLEGFAVHDDLVLYVTGGDGQLLGKNYLGMPALYWQQMTLEGIRVAAAYDGS